MRATLVLWAAAARSLHSPAFVLEGECAEQQLALHAPLLFSPWLMPVVTGAGEQRLHLLTSGFALTCGFEDESGCVFILTQKCGPSGAVPSLLQWAAYSREGTRPLGASGSPSVNGSDEGTYMSSSWRHLEHPAHSKCPDITGYAEGPSLRDRVCSNSGMSMPI
ncbi:hypothetical protein TREES_T100014123 [Tupaia chinensis]|uniref:Uncharacterized protein n=1 Tax=Tupaia chinensis TaxID=246437 RepID=L9KK07_TUPCH|nr:hypothetical protein TREES_T100014123 [Tupaia chinensis]